MVLNFNLVFPLAIWLTLSAPRARAYSVEISCGENGQLLDHQYRANSTADRVKHQRTITPSRVTDLCRDFKRCFGELADVAKLSRDTSDILQIYMARYERAQRSEATGAVARYHDQVARLQELLGDCSSYRGIQLANKAAGTVTVFYPHQGPLSGKVSRNYDLASLGELVRLAVKNGADPYMILALKILEDPPLKSESTALVLKANLSSGESTVKIDAEGDGYKNGYGLLPIDQIAARDVLGCRTESRAKLKTNVTPAQVREYQAIKKNALAPQIQMARLPRRKIEQFERQASRVDFYQTQIRSEQNTLEHYETQLPTMTGAPRADFEAKRDKSRQILSELQTHLDAESAKVKALSADPLIAQYQRARTEATALTGRMDEILLAATKNLGEDDAAAAQCVLKGKAECYGRAVPQAKVPTIAVSDEPGITRRACDNFKNVQAGDSMNFSFGVETGCCADVVAPASVGQDELRAELLTSLAITYAKKRVQSEAKPGAKLSWALQGYNGRSCFGCTEGNGYYQSTCMGKIDMNTRPVYGAKAADLITNSLMRNPAIVELVEAAAAHANVRPTSVLCLTEGRGVHLVSDQKFLDEQAQYLLRSEPARAKLCAPLFKNNYRSASAR